MNVFRICADMSHMFAVVILVVQIIRTKSCAGLSGKSQVFYLLVFLSRYLDLFTNFVSPYNTTMKILFIVLTALTVYLIYKRYEKTYDQDSEPKYAEIVLLLSFILAIVFNHEFAPMEILWTFSIYLESVAILPQLYMITKTGKAETVTVQYLLFLGCYRALYIANWAYRYYYEGFYDLIALAAGVVQTLLYIDFFYVFCTRSSIVSLDMDDYDKMDITNI